MKRWNLATAAIAALSLATAAHAATAAAGKCEAGKNSAVGKYASCLSKAQKKFVSGGATDTSGRDEAMAACATAYGDQWQSLEAKAGPGVCPSEGDSDSVQGFVRACVDSAEDALAGNPLLLDVATCNTDLDACDSNLATCTSDLDACVTGPVCGDSLLEGDEACEVGNLGGQDCISRGFAGGALACATGCTFDTSACYASRFDTSGPTVIDHQTGLEWTKMNSGDGVVNLSNALDADNVYTWCVFGSVGHCANTATPMDGTLQTIFLGSLNGANSGVCHAGHCDWRVPTLQELQQFPWPAGTEFGDARPDYWSATTAGFSSNYASFVVNPSGTAIAVYKHYTIGARAVRSAN